VEKYEKVRKSAQNGCFWTILHGFTLFLGFLVDKNVKVGFIFVKVRNIFVKVGNIFVKKGRKWNI
jgi:hypothetical protein